MERLLREAVDRGARIRGDGKSPQAIQPTEKGIERIVHWVIPHRTDLEGVGQDERKVRLIDDQANSPARCGMPFGISV